MTKRHLIAAQLIVLLCSVSNVNGQDCEPPADFNSFFEYPFGEQLIANWYPQENTTHRLTYGTPGFDPYLNEGDSIIFTGYNSVALGPNLPSEIHYDVYVQSICANGDTSSWLGPIDLYRDVPPEPCGHDPEHACELDVTSEVGSYFVIPLDLQGDYPVGVSTACFDYDQAAWYTFIAPDNGEVLVNAWRSSTYVSIFDETLTEIFCRMNPDTCIASEMPADTARMDSIPLMLVPGGRYYATTALNLFCDDTPGNFFYWSTGLQVTSNSPEILCVEPTDFEVHFENPFGETAVGYWLGESAEYEVYYGSPGFDPDALEGDSFVSTPTEFWQGTYFPSDTHFDAYVRAICDTVHSDWVGPVDVFRATPPDSCGWDMDHACEIVVSTICSEEYVVPFQYQAQFSYDNGQGCADSPWLAWYSFQAPLSGEVHLEISNSHPTVLVYDENQELIFCEKDSCISENPPVHITTLSLEPNAQYYLATSNQLFCDDTPNGPWTFYDVGICLTSNSPELLCDEPTDFEVHFENPFGETAVGYWLGESAEYEVYYGSPGFDPDALEGDSFVSTPTEFWQGTYFPSDTHFDAYVRAICDTVHSDWVGPVDVFRETPPDSCGWDLEHACMIYAMEQCTEYYVIPEAYQDHDVQSSSCQEYDLAGWYTFIVPSTGEVILDFVSGSQFYTLYNSLGEEVMCFNDTCIPGTGPEVLFDPVPLTLIPGEQYYVTTNTIIFWGDVCTPYWYSSGLCIQGVLDTLFVFTPTSGTFDCTEGIPPLDLDVTGGCPPYDIDLSEELTSQDACETIYTVTGLVSDQCENEASFTFTYTITDLIDPVVICPEIDTIWTSSGMAGQPFGIDDAFVSDNCSEDLDYIITPAYQEILPAGDYVLEYAVADACGNTAVCTTPLIIASPVGLSEAIFSQLHIYQQDRLLTIDYPTELSGLNCELYDLLGKKLTTTQLLDTPAQLDLQGLSTGSYLLTLRNEGQIVHSRSLRVE